MSFEERVFHVARNLVQYRLYHGDEARAVKMLRSHCRDVSLGACAAALRRYTEVWREGVAFVAAHVALYDRWRRCLSDPAPPELQAAVKVFLDAHPDIPRKLLSGVLFLIHDGYHVR